MSIEFPCSQCGRLLRTPEGTSGRQAKCPQCGALSTIPQASTPDGAAPADTIAALPPMSPVADSRNPYQSPTVEQVRAPAGDIRRGFQPTRIDLVEALSTTWRIYKADLWKCVGAAFFILVLTYAASFGVAFATTSSTYAVRQLCQILVNIASFWLSLGSLIFFLKVARGEDAQFADLFTGGPFLLRGIGVVILWGVMLVIGFLLLIIPYFIVLVMFSPAFLVLVDQDTGVVESLRMARQATSGNKLTLFAMYLLAMFVGALFTLVTCGIGFFFAQPFGTLLYAVSYLTMTGQSTAADSAYPAVSGMPATA